MATRVPSELVHILAAFAPVEALRLARATKALWARFRRDEHVHRPLVDWALSRVSADERGPYYALSRVFPAFEKSLGVLAALDARGFATCKDVVAIAQSASLHVFPSNLHVHEPNISDMAMAGTTLAYVCDRGLVRLNMETRTHRVLMGPDGIQLIAVHEGGYVFAVVAHSAYALPDLVAWPLGAAPMQTMGDLPGGEVSGMAVSASWMVVAIAHTGYLTFTSMRPDETIRHVVHAPVVGRVGVHTAGDLVLSHSDNVARVWNARSAECLHEVTGQFTACALAPDGRLAHAYEDDVIIYSADGAPVRKLVLDCARQVAFCADGSLYGRGHGMLVRLAL